MPLSFAAGVMENQLEASVVKTFIDIKQTTSLHSLDARAPRTVSTTSADPKKKEVAQRPLSKCKELKQRKEFRLEQRMQHRI